mmetsp:Transcript_13533/g.50347  ORF Transcript_13533/g.50347 Transcript_13533/m.50347 type:complete len:297 (-) Transcript_13533:326-1216(-)
MRQCRASIVGVVCALPSVAPLFHDSVVHHLSILYLVRVSRELVSGGEDLLLLLLHDLLKPGSPPLGSVHVLLLLLLEVVELLLERGNVPDLNDVLLVEDLHLLFYRLVLVHELRSDGRQRPQALLRPLKLAAPPLYLGGERLILALQLLELLHLVSDLGLHRLHQLLERALEELLLRARVPKPSGGARASSDAEALEKRNGHCPLHADVLLVVEQIVERGARSSHLVRELAHVADRGQCLGSRHAVVGGHVLVYGLVVHLSVRARPQLLRFLQRDALRALQIRRQLEQLAHAAAIS